LNVSTDPKYIESDSGFHVMKQIIENVNRKRDDIFWYVIAPKRTEKFLKTERTKVLAYPFSNWAVTNRYHFDFVHFKKIFDLDYDIDLIFNSQPELTANFYSIFNLPGRDERFKIPIINYLHWLAVPETLKYQKTTFVRQVEGIILSEFTGLNSKWAKKIFMQNLSRMRRDKVFSSFFNDKTFRIVDEKLQPLYLGSPLDEIDKYRKLDYDELARNSKERKLYKEIFEKVESIKTIVFNHRLMNYTGANEFIKYIKRLSKERKDFLVWLTDPNYKAFFENEKLDVIPNLLRVETLPWKVYIALLSRCYFSTACHPTYSAWSLSCIDTMSVCRPVLVPRAFAFPEIVGEDYELFFGSDLNNRETLWVHRASYLLDNDSEARRIGLECRRRVEMLFDWKKIIDNYIALFDKFVNRDFGEETESMRKLAEYVKKTGAVSKRDIFNFMGWSHDFNTKVTWQRYRNYLLSNDFIEDVSSDKVFFRHKIVGQRTIADTLEVPEIEITFLDEKEKEFDIEFIDEQERKSIAKVWECPRCGHINDEKHYFFCEKCGFRNLETMD